MNAIDHRNVRMGSLLNPKRGPKHAFLECTATTMPMRRTSSSSSTPTFTSRHERNGRDLAIVKAIAQAWHSRSCTSSRDSTATSEFDGRRLNFQSWPSRFKVEATRKANEKSLVMLKYLVYDSNLRWDFIQSLWDSYEIVAVSKRLETGPVFDGPYAGIDELNRGVIEQSRVVRRRRESKTTLRNLFNLMSSRRLTEPESPQDGTP